MVDSCYNSETDSSDQNGHEMSPAEQQILLLKHLKDILIINYPSQKCEIENFDAEQIIRASAYYIEQLQRQVFWRRMGWC